MRLIGLERVYCTKSTHNQMCLYVLKHNVACGVYYKLFDYYALITT